MAGKGAGKDSGKAGTPKDDPAPLPDEHADEQAAEPLPEQPAEPGEGQPAKAPRRKISPVEADEGPLDEPGTSIMAPATKAPEPKDPPLVDKPDTPGPTKRAPYEIGGKAVQPGYEATVNIQIANLSTAVPVSLPIRVVHGRDDGPTLFVSAAVHGDEIVGVEIIRRLLRRVTGHRINGTLLLVPVVNIFGFVTHDRYLPDRRDLNRSFPGNANGSLAAQLANAFRSEVVKRSDFGIDLHSAAVHRTN